MATARQVEHRAWSKELRAKQRQYPSIFFTGNSLGLKSVTVIPWQREEYRVHRNVVVLLASFVVITA
jgi:hypothetical protein